MATLQELRHQVDLIKQWNGKDSSEWKQAEMDYDQHVKHGHCNTIQNDDWCAIVFEYNKIRDKISEIQGDNN